VISRLRLALLHDRQVFLFRFFFSSRRRHTRSKRDWSSDVCSSDLKPNLLLPPPDCSTPYLSTFYSAFSSCFVSVFWGRAHRDKRSEERRVGKECRARWGMMVRKENGTSRKR